MNQCFLSGFESNALGKGMFVQKSRYDRVARPEGTVRGTVVQWVRGVRQVRSTIPRKTLHCTLSSSVCPNSAVLDPTLAQVGVKWVQAGSN